MAYHTEELCTTGTSVVYYSTFIGGTVLLKVLKMTNNHVLC